VKVGFDAGPALGRCRIGAGGSPPDAEAGHFRVGPEGRFPPL